MMGGPSGAGGWVGDRSAAWLDKEAGTALNKSGWPACRSEQGTTSRALTATGWRAAARHCT